MTTASARFTRDLSRRLTEAEATITALLSDQIDAVIDSNTKTPVLLAKAQGALRESEARFRRLWESGIILISVSNLDAKIVEINDAGLTLLGYSRDELIAGGLGWNDLTAPEWRQADEIARVQLLARGFASPWEKELICKDGRRVSVLAAAAMLEGAHRISIAVDLTDRKRAERDLEQRMQMAALTADIAMVLTHEDSLERVLQRCAEALVEHPGVAVARIWTLDAPHSVLVLQATAGEAARLADDDLQISVGQLKVDRIAETRQPYRTEMPEGETSTSVTAFAGHPLLVDDELVGVVALFSCKPLGDVVFNGLTAIADTIAVGIKRNFMTRANEQLEEQLRQAQKMEAVGRLAGGIAHDFNNILSVIMCSGDFILNDLELPEPVREDASEICKAAMRGADLTRQLLMFSRQQVLAPRVIDLHELLDHMEKMLRRILGEDVELVIRHSTAVGRVRVDPGSIEQVIMNLVVNARDAMPTGGTLTIETANVVLDDDFIRRQAGAAPGPHVKMSVTDTGTGMDEAMQRRIFEPFFTTKAVGKGTGLGLSTVFGIIQQSRGLIRVRSEPGQGTRFDVYVPQTSAVVEGELTSTPIVMRRGSETILLVEDEDHVRMVARAILRRHGYRIIDLRSPGEALLFCETERQQIDLLVTDVVMPQISGPELARRLVLMRPEMKVLCMSGYTDDSIVRHGVLEAKIAYLQKPFTPDLLARKVREVLDAARSTAEIEAT